jgi:uroporphyrin-III C-methyltransferase
MGYHALQHADVVVYDALVNADILKFADPGAELEYAGKRGGRPSARQRDISLRLVELAKTGKRVLRLKGGDPLIFGRGGEECQQLAKEGVEFRIVPGISSGVGGLAYAGIPATHRDVNHAVIFLTGHDSTGSIPANVDWHAVSAACPVIVMYMAVKNLGSIAGQLVGAGRGKNEPVAVVSKATLPEQSVVDLTLGEIVSGFDLDSLPTPALVVVGEVSSLRKNLDWYSDVLRENPLG